MSTIDPIESIGSLDPMVPMHTMDRIDPFGLMDAMHPMVPMVLMVPCFITELPDLFQTVTKQNQKSCSVTAGNPTDGPMYTIGPMIPMAPVVAMGPIVSTGPMGPIPWAFQNHFLNWDRFLV